MNHNLNQKQAQIALLLEPLEKQFSKLPPEKLKIYAERLDRFEHDSIRKAVENLQDSWEREKIPPVATILKEAAKYSKSGGARELSGEAESGMPWVASKHRAEKLAASYLEFFSGTNIARTAAAEGWKSHLDRYVRTCASFQAGIIAGVLNVGYSSAEVFIAPASEQDCRDFERRMREQAATGHIDVGIPTGHIQHWKTLTQALQGREKNNLPVVADGFMEAA